MSALDINESTVIVVDTVDPIVTIANLNQNYHSGAESVELGIVVDDASAILDTSKVCLKPHFESGFLCFRAKFAENVTKSVPMRLDFVTLMKFVLLAIAIRKSLLHSFFHAFF